MSIQSVGVILPIMQFEDAAGVPYAGGSLTFVATGTANALAVYSDPALTVSLGNVVTLNAAGRTSTSGSGPDTGVYCQQFAYDVTLKDATGTIVWGPTSFSGSQWPGSLQGIATLSPVANANGYTNRLTTTINKASSGTHSLFAGTRFDATMISAGASVLSEASTVYIEGAPNAGTNAYALHVGSVNGGAVKFDGPVSFSGSTGVCQGRLTLTTGNPVPVGDVTGAATLYWTPYLGNNIGLYDGVANWTILSFAELPLALGTLTAALPYDVFAYNNAGVVALRSPVAWTSATTRATAITFQNGVYVKSGATTDRYLGTFYTDSTTVTSDSGAGSATSGRHLYNYYNRVQRALTRYETTATWNYTTATVRQANASTANQVQVIQGVAEAAIDLSLVGTAAVNTAGSPQISVGIGEDSLTVYTVGSTSLLLTNAQVLSLGAPRLTKVPTVGHHVYSWNEWSQSGGTTTWYGAFASAGSTITAGLSGWINA